MYKARRFFVLLLGWSYATLYIFGSFYEEKDKKIFDVGDINLSLFIVIVVLKIVLFITLWISINRLMAYYIGLKVKTGKDSDSIEMEQEDLYSYYIGLQGWYFLILGLLSHPNAIHAKVEIYIHILFYFIISVLSFYRCFKNAKDFRGNYII